MSSTNGYEYTSRHPGWIQKNMLNKITDEEFKKLFGFYVINTPIVSKSYSGIDITKYGWDKYIFGNYVFKARLFEVARLQRDSTFAVAKTLNTIKIACEKTDLKKGFNKSRDYERVAIYKAKANEVASIFDHIRNAFAHGRVSVYDCENDSFFVLEDVKPSRRNTDLEVRARMVLKKSTLLKWIDIIEAGPNSKDYRQYLQSKQKDKKLTKEKKLNV